MQYGLEEGEENFAYLVSAEDPHYPLKAVHALPEEAQDKGSCCV